MFIDPTDNILTFRQKNRGEGAADPGTADASTSATAAPLSLLGRAGLHEIAPNSWKELGAGLGFLAALATHQTAQKAGPVLWVQQAGLTADEGQLFGPGFDHFGLKPDQILVARAHHTKDVLGILEEALATPELACVIGHLRGSDVLYDLTASRRLHLRAEQNKSPAFILRSGPDVTPSAALCRWQVAAALSVDLLSDRNISDIKARWRIDLVKSRISPPAAWHMDWRHDPHSKTHSFSAFPHPVHRQDQRRGQDRAEQTAPHALRA